MMTHEELLDSEIDKAIDSLPEDIEAMYAMFGDRLPNPHQYPRCFEHYAKLYFHMKRLNNVI